MAQKFWSLIAVSVIQSAKWVIVKDNIKHYFVDVCFLISAFVSLKIITFKEYMQVLLVSQ